MYAVQSRLRWEIKRIIVKKLVFHSKNQYTKDRTGCSPKWREGVVSIHLNVQTLTDILIHSRNFA